MLSYSIDSAILKYKQLKELCSESTKQSTASHSNNVTGDDMLMEGLAIRCHLLTTLSKKSSGVSCFLDAMTKILADLQKLQVNNMFNLLDKICQEVSVKVA